MIEFRLFEEGLGNKIVRFDRLRVIMPGGADLEQLDINEAFENSGSGLTVYLALPRQFTDRANVMQTNDDRRRYRAVDVDWRDENTGDNPQKVTVRRFVPRLILDGESRADLEAIPILRVARGTGASLGKPIADPSFVPPTLLLSGSPALRSIVERIANDCEASRSRLSLDLFRAGFASDMVQGSQITQLLKLQVLARYSARLGALVKLPSARPVDGYIELRALATELISLNPSEDALAMPEYDHDEPMVSYSQLDGRIRPLLEGSVELAWREEKLLPDTAGLVGRLQDGETLDPHDFYLAVDSSWAAKDVVQLVQDRVQFKFMSPKRSMQAVPGIKLSEERAAMGLPTAKTRTFFVLELNADEFSKKMWESIVAEKSVAVVWRGWDAAVKGDQIKLSLFIVPRGGRKRT